MHRFGGGDRAGDSRVNGRRIRERDPRYDLASELVRNGEITVWADWFIGQVVRIGVIKHSFALGILGLNGRTELLNFMIQNTVVVRVVHLNFDQVHTGRVVAASIIGSSSAELPTRWP